MKFIYIATIHSLLLALSYAAPASDPIADLRLACEVVPEKCPTAILEALESLPVNATIINPPDTISASAIETSPTGTSKASRRT
jgi:hypothetical protein